jgi:serine/threonine-protein kinase
LDQACAGDEALRREVESLLAASDEAGSFIERPQSRDMAGALATRLAAGATLGHYRIESLLGAGGMGEVYRARDPRLDRDVAIKVLSPHLSSHTDALSRFEREAKAVAALSHPNILSIHDFGQQDGVVYAVMELLEGETLRTRLHHQTSLPWREAVKIGAAIADGLAVAHAKGIIHRDIKPENVFLTSDGRIKILDFGIARVKPAVVSHAETLISQTPSSGAGATLPGTLLGTIGYMSPEQVRGETADAPSDIFSLGCLLAEMVTGRRPFSGANAADTMAAILRDQPPPLALDDDDLPLEFERIVLRCLEKRPEDRFQSARDLSLDLQSLVTAGASATPTAASRRLHTHSHAPARRRVQRRAWPVAAAALLVLGAIVGAIAWQRMGTRAPVNSIAVLPFANAGGDDTLSYLCEGLPEGITDSLTPFPQLKVMGWTTVRYKMKNRPDGEPRQIGRELNVRAVATGTIARRDDRLALSVEMIDVTDGSRLWGERYDIRLADTAATQSEIARRIADTLELEFSSAQQNRIARRGAADSEAYQDYLRGRYFLNQRADDDREDQLQNARKYFEQAVARDPSFALAHAGLAEVYVLLGDDFLIESRKGIAEAYRAMELDPGLTEANATIAFATFHYDWQWLEAEKRFLQVLKSNPRYPTAHHWYAEFLVTQGRFDEALREVRTAQDLEPLSVPIAKDWGVYLFFARRYDEAITQLRRALELSPKATLPHRWIASCYEQMGQYDNMVEEYLATAPANAAALRAAYQSGGVAGFRRLRLKGLYDALARGHAPAPMSFTYLHAALGEPAAALEWLEKAIEQKHFGLNHLKVEPRYDPIRAQPRFHAIMRRAGFTP